MYICTQVITIKKSIKMKKVFTKEEIQKRKGCYSKEKLDSLSFMNSGNEITIQNIINSEIPLKDKSWFIRNSCDLSLSEKKQFAIGCALVVLPIYENRYPKNNAPRKAIEAANLYLKNEISLDELKTAADAAYAADAAAAADAAYAAADAAAAAADAAYAAADAAAAAAAADAAAAAAAADAAAADAAYAAYAAAADINYKDLLLMFFKEFFK